MAFHLCLNKVLALTVILDSCVQINANSSLKLDFANKYDQLNLNQTLPAEIALLQCESQLPSFIPLF